MRKRIRLISLILLFSLLLAVFSGCGTTPATDETTDPGSESETGGQIQTKAFTKEELDKYKLIRSDLLNSGDEIITTCVSIRKALISATGSTIGLTTDWKDNKDEDTSGNLEFLLGKTNRQESADILETLKEGQFFIGVVGNKVVVNGVDTYAILAGLDYLLHDILKYDDTTKTAPKADVINIPVSYYGTYGIPTTLYVIGNSVFNKSGLDRNEMSRFASALQGLLNRPENVEKNDFYIYIMNDSQDSFWLDYLRKEGKLLENTRRVAINTYSEFWKAFEPYIMEYGMVVWDPEVAASSNVAATICGVEGYLPVMYDEAAGSLYSMLKDKDVPEKMSLVGLFNHPKEGSPIGDTSVISSGSSKCDAYLWAADQYLDKCAVDGVAYVLDAAGTIPSNFIFKTAQQTTPEYNQIFSHDYFIQNKMFFFDLTMVADEKPCDDPDQPMGTDAKTLKTLLQKFYDRAKGEMTTVYGFPMWWMKYTTFLDHGKTPATTLEWAFVELITTYNCLKEADAAHPAWMTNASVYSQYQLDTSKLKNNTEPAQDISFSSDTRYFTIYMGDYDSGAWMKNHIPTMFTDKARGTIPLMWGFNPNLSRRVPMVFEYVYENLTYNDFIVTGDSGAGYVIPTGLVSEALRNGRPDGSQKWIDFCEKYMKPFQMDIVGFIINGNNKMTNEIFRMYNEIAPVGSFHNDNSAGKRLTIYNGVPYLHLMNGIDPDGGEKTYSAMLNYINGAPNINFSAYRTVVKTPSQIAKCVDGFIDYAEANSRYKYEYVDPYTLFELILESGQGVIVEE